MCRDKNGLTEEEFLKSYNPDKYPKPSLTADICIFAHSDVTEILLVKRGGHPYIGKWALPGGFANKNEPIEKTASRELKEETGIEGVSMKLVGVYSQPGRDPRGWVVSTAFYADVDKKSIHPEAGDDAKEAKWFTIVDETHLRCGDINIGINDLAFDHADIIHDAIDKGL